MDEAGQAGKLACYEAGRLKSWMVNKLTYDVIGNIHKSDGQGTTVTHMRDVDADK